MHIFQVAPGTTLRFKLGDYWHYGILVHQGYVVHNSKRHRRVVKEPFANFAEGRNVEICSEVSSASLELACQRAHRYIGMAYQLFIQNCEHFVRLAHGLDPESPQIQKAVIAASAGTVALLSNNRAIQVTAICTGLGAALTPKGSSPIAGGFWSGVAGLTLLLALS